MTDAAVLTKFGNASDCESSEGKGNKRVVTTVYVDGGWRGWKGGSEDELEEFRHKNRFSSGEGGGGWEVDERVGEGGFGRVPGNIGVGGIVRYPILKCRWLMCVPCWARCRVTIHTMAMGPANGSLTLRTLLKYGGRHNGVILHLRTAYGFPCFFVIHRRVAKVFRGPQTERKEEKRMKERKKERKKEGRSVFISA